MARSDDEACCSVLEIREGRLLGKKHHFLGGVMESSDGEILSAFARQFYLQNDFVPPEIHLPAQLADADAVAAWLSQKADGKVGLATPQRGAKAQMLDMAAKNAAQMLAERQHKREMKRDRIPQSVYALQRDLQLAGSAPPHRRASTSPPSKAHTRSARWSALSTAGPSAASIATSRSAISPSPTTTPPSTKWSIAASAALPSATSRGPICCSSTAGRANLPVRSPPCAS